MRTWELPPEPKGDDEAEVKAFYERDMLAHQSTPTWAPKPWEELHEWQREAWRREVRDS